MRLPEIACPRCQSRLAIDADSRAAGTVACSRCGERVPLSRDPARTVAAGQGELKTVHNAFFPADDAEREAQRQRDYFFLRPAQMPDELGRLGSYRVLRELGRGGMGMVFEAEDEQLRRRVAIKVMLPAASANQEARQRFLREAQSAAALDHDNVVAIYQVGEDHGVPFITMPLLKGETLETRLVREGNVPVDQLARVGRQVAEGMAAAHALGLVHRDIKPGNIWLEEPRDRVKILDFGLARLTNVSDTAGLTNSGVVLGTPGYMAPEQVRAGKTDARTDLFSLGCVLYRMATGNHPFHAHDLMSSLMALALEDPPRPRVVNPAVPALIDDLIMLLLAKDPEQRPASAAEVAHQLSVVAPESGLFTAAGGNALVPTPPGFVQPPQPPAAGVAIEPPPLSPRPPPVAKSARLVIPPSQEPMVAANEAMTAAEDASSGSLWLVVTVGAGFALVAAAILLFRFFPGAWGDQAPGVPTTKAETTSEQFAWPADAPPPAAIPFSPVEAASHATAWAAYRGVSPTITNSLEMPLVFIPPGEFEMGSPVDETERSDDEHPHRVRLTRGFYLAIHELSQRHWREIMGTTPWSGREQVQEGDAFPAVCVSWDQATEFCRLLGEREQRVYRLPTEAEWEFAMRAGSPTKYPFGDDLKELEAFAWFRTSQDSSPGLRGPFAREPGQKLPNAFGLFDMQGNVWEWCHDRYDKHYYEQSPSENPTGPTIGSTRVRRGGSWASDRAIFRAAYRSVESPGRDDVFDLGFRVLLELPAVQAPRAEEASSPASTK